MNYIYDILLNWNTVVYDFYEWDPNDSITHVKRIPLIKVTTEILYDFVHSKVCLSKETLSKIEKKTEKFTTKNTKFLDYACLLSDGEYACAFLFDADGISIKKSRLLIDEEEEVLEVVLRMPEEEINYEVLSYEKERMETRKEETQKAYLKGQLKNLKKKKQLHKLEYLYYECFDKKENSMSKMLQDLNEAIRLKQVELIRKMESFFKLTSMYK